MPFQTPAWDLALFDLINDAWRTGLLDFLMPVISGNLLWWGVFLAVLGRKLQRGKWKTVGILALIALAVGLSDQSTYRLKHAFGRVRPLNAMSGVNYHEDGEWRTRPENFEPKPGPGTSYPSAHAANSMAAAVVIALAWRRAILIAPLLPLAVGYSRVYVGKHYPTDVMAGWVIGAVAGLLVYLAWQALRNRLAKPAPPET